MTHVIREEQAATRLELQSTLRPRGRPGGEKRHNVLIPFSYSSIDKSYPLMPPDTCAASYHELNYANGYPYPSGCPRGCCSVVGFDPNTGQLTWLSNEEDVPRDCCEAGETTNDPVPVPLWSGGWYPGKCCEETEINPQPFSMGAHQCPASGQGPNESKVLETVEDHCGNTIVLSCEPVSGSFNFFWRYNGTHIGECIFPQGQNVFLYWKTLNGQRFHSTFHRVRDWGPGYGFLDVWTRDEFDWKVTRYDCIADTEILRACRHSPVFHESYDEDDGESMTCPR
jgi:hypothetical protein